MAIIFQTVAIVSHAETHLRRNTFHANFVHHFDK
ncbi:hypothetical protein D046_1111, partial [Vibrio parahaemolyticus V-223/04]